MGTVIAAFVLGFVFTHIFQRYNTIRHASELVFRVFLFPFYALVHVSTLLLFLAVWLARGDQFRIEQDKHRYEKVCRGR